jgi:anti-anti-sigma factor
MSDHPRLEIDRVRAAPDHELRLTGELTAETAANLRVILDQLLDLTAPQVWSMTLDLGGLSEIDPAGITALCEIQAAMVGRGGELAVVHPPEAVRRALMMARLGQQALEDRGQNNRSDESSSPRSAS